MPKKIKHIFYTPFTGKGLYGGFRGQDWYRLRTEIFEKYTLKSLMAQTSKDFLLWVSFRPEEIFNPVTKKIANAITKSKLQNIMSFNGIMMTDDKVIESNNTLKERLEAVLPNVKKAVGDADYIYETNLDSDDMVHTDFSKLVQGEKFRDKGALYCKKGFAYNIQDRLAHWLNPESNQNYTIMFPQEDYFNAEKRIDYLNNLSSHEQVPKKFDAKQMPDGMYCTVIHGTNISTIWNHPFMGEEIPYEDEKQAILKEFGV